MSKVDFGQLDDLLDKATKELERLMQSTQEMEYLRADIRALEAENEALRDLLYDLGITDPNPLDMRLGAIGDIRRALELAGIK